MLGELGEPLDRDDLRAELGEHRGLVAGAGADVERLLSGPERERLADLGHHVGLRDRLAVTDRERRVLVCAAPLGLGHEELARDALHRVEHTLVDGVAAA